MKLLRKKRLTEAFCASLILLTLLFSCNLMADSKIIYLVNIPKSLTLQNPNVKNVQSFNAVLEAIDLMKNRTGQSVLIKDFGSDLLAELMKNEKYIKRPDVEFVFLIRNPEKAIPSYLVRLRDLSVEASSNFDPSKAMSYEALLEFYIFLKDLKKSVTVLFPDHLDGKCSQLAKRACESLEIPLSETVLQLNSGTLDGWYSETTSSSSTLATVSDAFLSECSDAGLPLDQLNKEEKRLCDVIYKQNFDSYLNLLYLSSN